MQIKVFLLYRIRGMIIGILSSIDIDVRWSAWLQLQRPL